MEAIKVSSFLCRVSKFRAGFLQLLPGLIENFAGCLSLKKFNLSKIFFLKSLPTALILKVRFSVTEL